MKQKNVKVTVGGIILRNNKVLLTKRKVKIEKGKWCLPGGHIEIGESAEEAIKREIKEETGLDVKKVKFLFYQDEFIKKLDWSAVVLVFLVEAKGKLKENAEVSEFRFFSKSEIEKMNLAFKNKEILNKFLRNKK